MSELRIVRHGNYSAQVFAPYDPRFPDRMRSIHGTWDKPGKCWWISSSQIEEARKHMREIFGQDDLSGKDTVSLLLRFTEGDGAYRKDYVLYGKVLSHATSKTSGGVAGEDVFFIEGSPESGGSVSNWCSVIPAGSVIRLHNVHRDAIDKTVLPVCAFMEVLNEYEDPKRESLIREREELMKRIKQIDELLAKL